MTILIEDVIEERIARDLPGRKRARADSERRIECGEQSLCVGHIRQLPNPSDERVRDRVTRLVEAVKIGLLLAALQSRGTGP